MRRDLVVADDIASATLDRFLDIQPRTIALAGGATPAAFYRRLAGIEYMWAETDMFFGDERCVAPDHPDSNYRMARETLLDHVAARVHPMPGSACDPEAYERELSRTFGDGMPRFDLVLLGLGADGHTASLFPGDPALDEQVRRVVRVERPDHARLSLTPPALSAARTVIFLVSGTEKREPLGRLLADDATTPAALVRAASVVVIADPAAVPPR